MDHPAQELFQQLHSKAVSGEHLEVLGKKAAADWVGGKYGSLSASVIETVKQASLSPEQVRRVVEFANTDAFLTEFKKEGAGHRVVDFGSAGPADFGEVLQALNSGGSRQVFDRGTSDYTQPPTEKSASSHLEEELFHSLQGSPEVEENPYHAVLELKDKLAGVRDVLGEELSALELLYEDASNQVYQEVKQASLNGYELGEILQGWQCVTPSAEHAKIAFGIITPRLLQDGVFYTYEKLGQSLEKTGASRMVNPEHPLVTSFGDYCAVLDKLAAVRLAHQDTHTALNDTVGFLKRASTLGQLHEGAKAVGQKAAPFVAEHLGAGAGKAVEFAGKAAVPAGGLIAANEIRRKLNHSSTVHKALSVVPGTGDYQQREYDLAQRGGY